MVPLGLRLKNTLLVAGRLTTLFEAQPPCRRRRGSAGGRGFDHKMQQELERKDADAIRRQTG